MTRHLYRVSCRHYLITDYKSAVAASHILYFFIIIIYIFFFMSGPKNLTPFQIEITFDLNSACPCSVEPSSRDTMHN